MFQLASWILFRVRWIQSWLLSSAAILLVLRIVRNLIEDRRNETAVKKSTEDAMKHHEKTASVESEWTENGQRLDKLD